MTEKTYENIKFERAYGITWAVFNRPDTRNGMSPELDY